MKIPKSEIARFIDGLEKKRNDPFVKFPYKFDGKIEHVWGLAHQIKNDDVIVSLKSMPIGEPTDDEFERLSIKLKSIENCMLVDPKVKKHEEYSILELAKIYTRDYGKLPRSCTKYLARLVGLSWLKNA